MSAIHILAYASLVMTVVFVVQTSIAIHEKKLGRATFLAGGFFVSLTLYAMNYLNLLLGGLK